MSCIHRRCVDWRQYNRDEHEAIRHPSWLFFSTGNCSWPSFATRTTALVCATVMKPKLSSILGHFQRSSVSRLTEDERKDDIPIVALNPGGILNWKYKAETSLRKSSLRHCVVRATGLIAEGKGARLPSLPTVIFFCSEMCFVLCFVGLQILGSDNGGMLLDV